MSEPGAAIPDDVMREAVRAVDDMLFGPMSDDLRNAEIRSALAAAVPILTPAIERALLERIADEANTKGMELFARNGMDIGAEELFEREEWIRSSLPTEDEEVTT